MSHDDLNPFDFGQLRRWTENDLESLICHADDERVSLHMGPLPYPYTREDGESFLARAALAPESDCTWAIEIAGEAIGGIGVSVGTGVRSRTGELGYWLGHAHWGKGIASKAVATIIPIAVERLKLLRVGATVFSPNRASARVLEENGFVLEGALASAITKGDQVWDELLYGRVFPVAPAE